MMNETINNFLPILSFQVLMDVKVVGHDSERADYDNREGAIFGDVYYIVATVNTGNFNDASDGRQFAHRHHFVNDGSSPKARAAKASAEALLAKIEARVKAGKELKDAYWRDDIEPCYGTQAWLMWNAEHPETWND